MSDYKNEMYLVGKILCIVVMVLTILNMIDKGIDKQTIDHAPFVIKDIANILCQISQTLDRFFVKGLASIVVFGIMTYYFQGIKQNKLVIYLYLATGSLTLITVSSVLSSILYNPYSTSMLALSFITALSTINLFVVYILIAIQLREVSDEGDDWFKRLSTLLFVQAGLSMINFISLIPWYITDIGIAYMDLQHLITIFIIIGQGLTTIGIYYAFYRILQAAEKNIN